MNLDNAQSAIYTWLQRESGLPADKVIWAEQSEHRPTLPYASVKFLNTSIRVGSIDHIKSDGDEFTTQGLRECVLSINIFGLGANDLMAKVRDSLDRPDVMDEFNTVGLSTIGEDGPRDLTELMETKYQERSQMDVSMYYAQERTTSIVPIEEVVFENEILDEETAIDTP